MDQSRDGKGEVMSSVLLLVGFFSVNTCFQKDACYRHHTYPFHRYIKTYYVSKKIPPIAGSEPESLLKLSSDWLTLIASHISNTSYYLQYLYCPVGYKFGAKPNLITWVTEIF